MICLIDIKFQETFPLLRFSWNKMGWNNYDVNVLR